MAIGVLKVQSIRTLQSEWRECCEAFASSASYAMSDSITDGPCHTLSTALFKNILRGKKDPTASSTSQHPPTGNKVNTRAQPTINTSLRS